MGNAARALQIAGDSGGEGVGSSERPGAGRRAAPRISRLPQQGRLPHTRGARKIERAALDPGVGAFTASLLSALPLATTLELDLPGVVGAVKVTTSEAAAQRFREDGWVVLDGREWEAIVIAAESDRLWPGQMWTLCLQKSADPSLRITPQLALGGARAEAPRHWTVGSVLSRIGATLVAAEVEQPDGPTQEALPF